MQWVVTLAVLCSKQKSDWMIDVYLFEHQTSRVFGRHVCLNQRKGLSNMTHIIGGGNWNEFSISFLNNETKINACSAWNSLGPSIPGFFSGCVIFSEKIVISAFRIPKPGWRDFFLTNFMSVSKGRCAVL